MARLTAMQRIQKAHIWVFSNPNYAFLSGVCMVGKTEVVNDPKMPTAGTDGKNKFYNEAFVNSLSDIEIRFLVLHENYHVAARHMTIYKDLWEINARRANIAMDHWINLSILDQDPDSTDVKMIAGGCADPKYRGWPVKKIFNDLPQDTDDSGGFDVHDFDNAEVMSTDEKVELGTMVDQALRQGGILAGKLKGTMPREIGELLEPTINWREVLADFVKETMNGKDEASWSKINRRFVGQGVYLPSLISNTMGRLCVAIDTSGSIGEREIQSFASELVSICTEVVPAGVSLLWWDSDLAAVQTFNRGEFDGIDQKLEPKGGGGTNAECVKTWLEDSANGVHDCVVLFSDGYVPSWPGFNIPALWALTTKNLVSDSGRTVYVDLDA